MDVFSTNFLLGVIEGLPPSPTDLLDRYFPRLVTEESEEIHWDKSIRYRLLAPFVSPVVEGAIVEERGFTTETFKPAYLKPKTPLDPTRAVKRIAGEPLGGTMSPQDRQMRRIADVLADQRAYIDRRLEWMASQVLQLGQVTVSGEKYQTVVVNFQRDAALTITLTAGDRWSQSTATPDEDLHAWNELAMQKPAGAPVTDFIMDPDAFQNFRKHAAIKDRLDVRRDLSAELRVRAATREGLRYMGTVDTFDIYVYQAWYETTIGTLLPFFPSGTVVGASPMVEGVQQFGAIIDEDALIALRYFPKSWTQDDPSRRFVMTQSAPLVVPGKPNATVKASVL